MKNNTEEILDLKYKKSKLESLILTAQEELRVIILDSSKKEEEQTELDKKINMC